MSVVARVASGSAAAWVQIGTAVLVQLALVPIYLSRWSAEQYGLWISVLAITNLSQVLDIGHHNYLQYEFLRIGKKHRRLLRRVFSSSLVYAYLLGGIQLAVVITLVSTNAVETLVAATDEGLVGLGQATNVLLLAHSFVWWLVGSVGGILTRALVPFGYYPRTAWWTVTLVFITSVTPAVMVLFFDASFLIAGLSSTAAMAIANLFLWSDMWVLLRKEKMRPLDISWRVGLRNMFRSQALALRHLLEILRQQGLRLLLAPLVGASQMVAFATMRTMANTASQGVGTVVNPLVPELLRFIGLRDQVRFEAGVAAIWFVVACLVVPGVFLMQIVIDPVFSLWTRGKVTFDPFVFGALSVSVLVYAVAHPAMTVVQGANLLRLQLILSGMAAVALVLAVVVFVPNIGIRGAALAILLAEALVACGYVLSAYPHLRLQRLAWPWSLFKPVVFSVLIVVLHIVAIVFFPEGKAALLFSFSAINLWLSVRYWRRLPELVRQRIRGIF